MKRLLLLVFIVAGISALSCTESSRTPSPSQQAVGLYKGEMALVNEITGDTLESQGGINLRVDPMEPEVVKLSFLRLRFATADYGDVHMDANIQRLSEVYLALSAYNKEVSILHNTQVVNVYISGWHDHDDINLTIRTSMMIDGVATVQDIVTTYSGRRR